MAALKPTFRFLVASKPADSTRVGWDLLTPHGKYYAGVGAQFPIASIGGDAELHDTLSGFARYLADVPAAVDVDSEPINGLVYRVSRIVE